MTTETTRWEYTNFLIQYKTRTEDPVAYSYDLECTRFKVLTVTLDFTGSKNFAIDGQKGMKITVVIRPFSRVHVGRVQVIDCYKSAQIKMDCDYEMSDPSPEETAAYIKTHKLKMGPILKEAVVLPFPPAAVDITDEHVHQVCQSYGKKFVDKDFLPTASSLFKTDESAKSTKGASTTAKKESRQVVEWKRAADFMKGEYHVFESGIEPADIKQGALGNCWFLCAIAALTEFPQLVLDLIETKEVNEHGVYRVRFCKNGWWQSVRVDDFFPCFPNEGPIYSRANGNELWVMLLEKAFSKLCGSYEAIKSGWAYEGMMDMTGAPCKVITFEDAEEQAKIRSGQLWRDLLSYDQQSYIMAASSKSNALGLVAHHAYTLVSVKQTKRGDKLLKLRNPWGSTEWTGDWSDESPLWTDQMQAEVERVQKADDGIFWMCFEDFLKHFGTAYICMVRHEKYHPLPWTERRSRFYYHCDPSKFTVSVPSYELVVSEKGDFVLEVHQEDERCAGAKEYIDIGVTVKRLNPSNGSLTEVARSGNCAMRQYGTSLIELDAGIYTVTPSTTGTRLKASVKKDAEAPAATAAHSPPALVHTNDAGSVVFTDATVNTYGEIFDLIDLDNDGLLSKDHLDLYMVRTEGSPVHDKAFEWLKNQFGPKDMASLTKNAFIRAQQFVFQNTGANEEKIRNDFRIMGYNTSLKYASGRGAVLSVHGTEPFTLTTNPAVI